MKKTEHKSGDYDVAIIGGGLAGLTTACLLGRARLTVACIDQADPNAAPGDLRTTAISYGSSKILEDAGIWEKLGGRTCAIEDIQILDGSSSVLLNFLSEEVEGKAFGWIVENADLRAAMSDTMAALDRVHHLAPEKVTGFSTEVDHVRCSLPGREIRARLVIGADGRNSFTRSYMGVATRQWSYRQRAVICTVAHENPHNNIAVEHFWPEGPFAILPMSDDDRGVHRSSVVFTEHGPESRSLMKMDDTEFEMALAARFPESYGAVNLIGRRAVYPLGLVHAAEYVAPRMALVADAAHGIHPIAGQGLNLGFRDIKALADLVRDAHEKGGDIGGADVLQAYQRKRRIDNMAMVAMTDGLNRLFSNNIGPVRALRRAGLRMVSRISPAKRFFMKQAMGERSESKN